MFKINWINTAENLIFALVFTVFGVFIGHKVTLSTNNSLVNQIKPIINRAIDKETVKNETNNEINTRKIKNAKDLNLVLKPNTQKNAVINNNLYCIDTSYLSLSEKKRLKRWLKK